MKLLSAPEPGAEKQGRSPPAVRVLEHTSRRDVVGTTQSVDRGSQAASGGGDRSGPPGRLAGQNERRGGPVSIESAMRVPGAVGARMPAAITTQPSAVPLERIDDMGDGVVNGREPAPRRGVWRVLRGLLTAQAFGQFNDNAWKQIVILLATATVVSEAAKMEKAAFAQVILLVPLVLFSLPAGVLADRASKRSVILAMKALELVLMLAGTAALLVQPQGGVLAMAVLGLLGVQTALFGPAKYGIFLRFCLTSNSRRGTACWR